MHPCEPAFAALVCELTGVGRGGVATVAVWGQNALWQRYLQPFFRPARSGALPRPGDILYGTWHAAGREQAAGESVVVTAIDSQHIQVHCHGGRAAVESIMADIGSTGAGRCEWPQWLAASGCCPLEIEARQVLATTDTRRTAAIALDQLRGALRRAAESWLQTLQSDAAQLPAVQRAVADVLRWTRLGKHLGRPWQIVLAGAPNVGKSSLLNALLGYRRAITFDQPGTTRDVVSADTVLDGWSVSLADTAGLRDAGDSIENQGVQRARASIDEADLVLWVHDAADPAKAIPDPAGRTDCLIVDNKIDLVPDFSAAANRPYEAVAVSATSGQGMAELMQRIVQTLVPELPPAGQAIAITDRQAECLNRAVRADTAASACAALEQLLAGRSEDAWLPPPPTSPCETS
ncbi:GTPase [Roseimaritima ulvae]|uniref:tRNA modification GTPase MnmE n=1 Tax=Roseimaritima ulvae TaxID=980254 RepID=A0A5B9QI68_9BACT|nr:GTPase [Roseimaritima ulvae]QEG38564.1 tRNA modification GTPase MnmE [Roseimaritima ulvae]